MASSKPAAKPASTSTNSRVPVPEAVTPKTADTKPKYQSLQDRARSYADERAKTGVGMYGTRTGKAAEYDAMAKSEVERLRGNYPTKGRGVIETRNLDKDTLLPKRGMKKGGDVKGWGSARGARKAKIY